MPKFAIERINVIQGKQPFYQLIIDEVKTLETFEKEILNNPQYLSEYRTLLKYMEYFADGGKLPRTKFNLITPKKHNDVVLEFEFKSDHLRIYGIKDSIGNLIFTCGYKNSQKKDISNFQSLKKQYLATFIK